MSTLFMFFPKRAAMFKFGGIFIIVLVFTLAYDSTVKGIEKTKQVKEHNEFDDNEAFDETKPLTTTICNFLITCARILIYLLITYYVLNVLKIVIDTHNKNVVDLWIGKYDFIDYVKGIEIKLKDKVLNGIVTILKFKFITYLTYIFGFLPSRGSKEDGLVITDHMKKQIIDVCIPFIIDSKHEQFKDNANIKIVELMNYAKKSLDYHKALKNNEDLTVGEKTELQVFKDFDPKKESQVKGLQSLLAYEKWLGAMNTNFEGILEGFSQMFNLKNLVYQLIIFIIALVIVIIYYYWNPNCNDASVSMSDVLYNTNVCGFGVLWTCYLAIFTKQIFSI